MRRINLTALLIAAGFIMCTCSLFPPPETGFRGLSRIDLSGAKALAIVPESMLARGDFRADSDTNRKLAKVTAEGDIVVVTCYDDDGNEISREETLTPNDLFPVGNQYVLATYWIPEDSAGTFKKIGYLIRTSDGAVFSLENAGAPQQNVYFKNEPQAWMDSHHNIYYKKETVASGGMPQGDTAVMKVDISDPENPTAQQISAQTDTVQFFTVDPDGNVLYADGNTIRLRKRTGGLFNLASSIFWIGPAGEIFTPRVSGAAPIRKLTVHNDGTVTAEAYGSNGDINFPYSPDSAYLFRSAGKILCVSESSSSSQYVELYNAEGNPQVINGLPELFVQAAYSSGDFYYIGGQDSGSSLRILKISASDYSYEDMVDPGVYDNLSQMIVDMEGNVTFFALDLNRGVTVLARIGAVKVDGIYPVTILQKASESETVTLVRIDTL